MTNMIQTTLGKAISCLALLVAVLLCFVTIENRWGDWRLVDEPLHSTVEAVAGVAALVIATFLSRGEREKYCGKLFLLAVGFLGMGVLDVMHATTTPGQGFVLLHSTASLVGGVWFALVWLPR